MASLLQMDIKNHSWRKHGDTITDINGKNIGKMIHDSVTENGTWVIIL